MQVALNPDDRVGRRGEARVRQVLEADVAGGVNDGATHVCSRFRWFAPVGPTARSSSIKARRPGI